MRAKIIDALVHLRFHFSVLLLPVFLFAVSQAETPPFDNVIAIFIILHLLVYPASNGFNSYHDKDSGSIGGLKSPPPTNKMLLYFSNAMDLIAILLSIIFIDITFALLIAAYILASRAYSARQIRVKKYPILGFLWVIIFQGAFTFLSTLIGLGTELSSMHYLAALAASLQIGAVYPISQIYQHKEDLADGVKTISYMLGYRGTFYFSALCFALANLCYAFYFGIGTSAFTLLMLIQLPVVIAFVYWYMQVHRDTNYVNFKNTMRFNVLAAITFNLFYILLILKF